MQGMQLTLHDPCTASSHHHPLTAVANDHQSHRSSCAEQASPFPTTREGEGERLNMDVGSHQVRLWCVRCSVLVHDPLKPGADARLSRAKTFLWAWPGRVVAGCAPRGWIPTMETGDGSSRAKPRKPCGFPLSLRVISRAERQGAC